MTVGAALVVLVLCAFYAYALADLARTPPWAVRTYSKEVWILLLVFTNVFGALLWFYAGRPQGPRS